MNPLLTSTTETVEPIFMYMFLACLLLLLGITVAMLFFVIRYHRSRSPQPTSAADNNFWLEVVWTLLPTALVLGMFYYGWSGYLTLRTVPKNALTITATARMWSWSFTYENGAVSPKLIVPVGKPVRIELVSVDVIHGFFLPAFRVKRDVVPGMKNQVWFVSNKPGSYDLFCSQYCGTAHSSMISTVEALPEAEFTAWLNKGGKSADSKPDGRKLAEENGCLGCHTLDGSPGVGPSFKGLFGSRVNVVKDGKPLTVTADEAFIRESIRQPGATIVEGFPAIMPTSPDISDPEVEALLEFIRESR